MTERDRRTITRLGSDGDGIADGVHGTVYVPFALPGELVEHTDDDLWRRVGTPNSERIQPVCRHFERCGGCAAQHMSAALYRNWKHEIVATALRQRGLDVAVDPVVTVPAQSRRRAVLTARSVPGGLELGYHARKSHDLVALEECPVLVPEIANEWASLKALVQALPRRSDEVRLHVAALAGGLDVAITGGHGSLSAVERARLSDRAAAHRIARLTLDGEIIVTRSDPTLITSAGAIVPPPAAFFQAVAAAETAMAERVVAAARKSKLIVDLFSGLGTFSLPLARVGKVVAVDSDKALLAALDHASRHAQGLKPIETKLRDLVREPLSVKELEGFDCAVFDPPRAGAAAQAAMLAKSKVKVVVAVSCNPATLARDARTLVDGGYAIASVTPIDQFLYSAHIEAVAVFRRGA